MDVVGSYGIFGAEIRKFHEFHAKRTGAENAQQPNKPLFTAQSTKGQPNNARQQSSKQTTRNNTV
jgi:hypothetical protein